ncbi:TPA: hypothetical protein ACH3X1_002173 [Trebouxia sp. C0004]
MQRPHMKQPSDQGQALHQLWSPGLDARAMKCARPDSQEQGPRRGPRWGRRGPGGAGRGRHSDCLPPLAGPVDTLVPILQLPAAVKRAEALEFECRKVCLQALLCFQLLGCKFISKVKA